MRRAVGRPAKIVWRLVFCAAVLGVVANTTVLSGANFTSNRTTNPGNVFAAGTLRLTNTKDGLIIIAATGIRPGESQQGTCTLTNSGTVAGSYQVLQAGLTDTPASPALSGALTLTVTDLTAGTQLWTGAMNTLTTVPLGTFAVGEARDYQFTIAYPAAVPGLQGAQTAMTLRFAGTSL